MTASSGVVALLGALAATVNAQPVVTNASFEQDGAEIKGVGYIGQGNPISGWRATFPGLVGRNPQDGPFVDNGVIPDGRSVCVLQNLAGIAQTISGLRAGKVYRIAIRANGRASDAPDFGGLSVELNGSVLVSAAHVEPVGFGKPYRTYEAYFTAGTGSAELEIRQINPKSGVSVLIDDIHIDAVAARRNDKVIAVNPATPITAPRVAPEQDLTDLSWIWTDETAEPAKSAPIGKREFVKRFSVLGKPKRAVVTFTADNRSRLMINGRLAGWSDTLSRLYHADVTHLLRSGSNTLVVEAENAGPEKINPAGMILKMVVFGTDAAKQTVIASDGSWRWRMPGAAATRSVRLAGDMGCAPWNWIGPVSPMVSKWFPNYAIPRHEGIAAGMRRLFALHAEGGRPQCTLWDGWQSLAGLWPVRGRDLNDDAVIRAWKEVLLSRDISDEGYVATHQHRGFGHSKGWPIPLYMQTGGVGFHFSLANDPFAVWVPAVAEPKDWTLEGMDDVALDRARGWELRLSASRGTVDSPRFDIPMAAAPFVRVEWQALEGKVSAASVQWATDDRPDFDDTRRIEFAPVTRQDGMAYSDVPVCRSPGWTDAGRMTRIRLNFNGDPGTRIVLKSVITPADTRHNINNAHFVMGSAIYLGWTGDLDFLRKNIARMRVAMAYSIKEFRLREALCVETPWYGHDGRGGFIRNPDGSRTSRYAGGVGNNYWDLLPFGGKDTNATIYHYEALRRMAEVERLIRANPQWRVPADGPVQSPGDLETLAEGIKAHAGKLLWNPKTGRFAACMDVDGVLHDYGYAILNLEAIHYGFATPEQAKSILEWLDGKRTVEGDSAQGADIYRWRFGPRCSTKRNTEWYSGMWEPLSVAWGDQVQDGGGVLGFSYFDLMARLRSHGPDDAAKRLGEIVKWFDEVQAEGGYRSYYAKPGRGTLQGGGPPGGLGLDYEFVESALVPQVLLYGFLGYQPGMVGFRIEPRLPRSWPSLKITRVRYHGVVMDVKADRRSVEVTVTGGKPNGVVRWLPPSKGSWAALLTSPGVKPSRRSVRKGGLTLPTKPGTVVRMIRA